MSMRRNFVFIGAPSTGKGSFGKKVALQLGYKHISLGKLIRDEVSRNTSLGQSIQGLVETGSLVPDTIANSLALNIMQDDNRFVGTEDKIYVPVIFDGYPRTIDQAITLKKSFPKHEFVAVNIMLEKWVAVEKCLGRRTCMNCNRGFNVTDIQTGGFNMPSILPDPSTCPLGPSICEPNLTTRKDDLSKIIIEKRYDEYLKKTTPLLNFYKLKNLLRNFTVKKGMEDTDELIRLMMF